MTVAFRWLHGKRYAAGEPLPSSDKRAPFASPQISSDYAPYDCPVTGRTIDGRIEHRANLERHGCRVIEKGETAESKRRKEDYTEAKTERQVNAAITDIAAQI